VVENIKLQTSNFSEALNSNFQQPTSSRRPLASFGAPREKL
jgi:hypothetical protein